VPRHVVDVLGEAINGKHGLGNIEKEGGKGEEGKKEKKEGQKLRYKFQVIKNYVAGVINFNSLD